MAKIRRFYSFRSFSTGATICVKPVGVRRVDFSSWPDDLTLSVGIHHARTHAPTNTSTGHHAKKIKQKKKKKIFQNFLKTKQIRQSTRGRLEVGRSQDGVWPVCVEGRKRFSFFWTWTTRHLDQPRLISSTHFHRIVDRFFFKSRGGKMYFWFVDSSFLRQPSSIRRKSPNRLLFFKR